MKLVKFLIQCIGLPRFGSMVLGIGVISLGACHQDSGNWLETDEAAHGFQIGVEANSQGQHPTCGGFTAFPGESRWVPAFPDKASRYDSYAFSVQSGNYQALKLTGQFPYARYYSINIYNSDTGNVIGALTDRDIHPEPGSNNPFQEGAQRGVANRDFVVYLVPEGSSFTPPSPANVLTIPAGVETVSLLTRVYRPDLGYDNLGGVGLPTISPVTSQGQAQCPATIEFDIETLLALGSLVLLPEDVVASRDILLDLQQDETIFIRATGEGFFPNADNLYLYAALDNSKITVLRFKAPSFEDTYLGSQIFQGDTETRFWSICVGGLGLTTTSACVEDDQTNIDADGYATVAIGPAYLKAAAEEAGVTYISKGLLYKPIVIHRHLLDAPDFSGRLILAPQSPKRLPADFSRDDLDALDARTAIGDYAPTGQVMNEVRFRLWLRSLD